MFVLKRRYTDLQDDFEHQTFELQERDRTIASLSRQLESMEAQFHRANAAYTEAHTSLQREVRALLERLVTAEGDSRKGLALIAMWAVRVNQLQAERDGLLSRCLPGLELRTPHVSPTSVLDPAVSFEHDPFASPVTDPNTLTPLVPESEDLGGMPGEIYAPDTP